MTITLLHTATSHCARFDALRDEMAPDVNLKHTVREDWLSAAQTGMTAELAGDISAWINDQDIPVLCTCTTLGPVAEAAGAMRIDRPLMQAAARLGEPVLMVYCLESTRASSEALLREEMGDGGEIYTLSLATHWSLFEAGDLDGFAAALAGAIRSAAPTSGCVVLAQASMAGAASLLSDLPVPVLASPELALRAVLGHAGLQIG